MNPPTPPPSTLVSLFYKSGSTREFKLLHARHLVSGHAHLPSAALRPLISFSSLRPTGDIRYAILLLLTSPVSRAAPHFLFNTAIRGLARRPSPASILTSVLLLRRMDDAGLRPNNFTFTFLFQTCAAVEGALGFGVQLHALAVRSGFVECRFVVNSVVKFYSVRGGLDDARRVFEECRCSDVVSWNSMIGGCLRKGKVSDAFVLFDRMPERNTVSWNGMISGLIRNGRMDSACALFDEMPERNLASWAVMVGGYAQTGRPKEALLFFREMQGFNYELNAAVLVSALSAASQLGALEHGKWIHAYVKKNQIYMENALSTALVSMYANCGSIDLAMQVFYHEAAEKDVSTYTAAVLGLAVSGRGEESLSLFEQMKRGVEPDGVSYIAVLCACSHMGWVDKGFGYFSEMVDVRGIEAELDHYACMVDLLGRAGFLEVAERFIDSMPMEADNVVWGALLNACRIHGNSEMGRRVGEHLIELDRCHDGRYVVLSNVYAESSKKESAQEVRRIMRQRKVKRVPGFSSLELNGIVYEFTSGDKSHDRTEEIYSKWEEIVREIRKSGYVEETRGVVFDVEEEEKEAIVGHHSEKLAIAFGFICTEKGIPLRIVKNIRICSDCHSAAKLISLVFERVIVIRDRKRFHHFEGGSCSCLDFW